MQCKQPLLFRVSARLTPHNSAWPPNHHWHAADQAIIKETFSLCDVYWWEVMNKNNLNHFPSGLQENWMQHSFLLLPCFSRRPCFYFIIVNTALYFHLFSSLCSFYFFIFLTIIIKIYFLLHPSAYPHLCHPFSCCYLPTSCLSRNVWAEAIALGRVGCGISVSACLCNRRRRLSGPLSADQHRCRWEVKISPVTRTWRQ